MPRDARSDVVLLGTLDNQCFATTLRTKKSDLFRDWLRDWFLMIPLLNIKRRKFLWKNISEFRFSCYITQIILTYYMKWIVFRSSAGQIVNSCS